MIEAKKFIFLSRWQRNAVSTVLGTLLLISSVLLYLCKTSLQDPEIKLMSIDLIKLTVTAWGAWGLILLYASSNSFSRIDKETLAFLKDDLSRPFLLASSQAQATDLKSEPTGDTPQLRLISESYQGVKYAYGIDSFKIYFLCRLNVQELSVLVYLPAKHEKDCETIYKTSLSYLREKSETKVTLMGVNDAGWLEPGQKRFELQIFRLLSEDFLFDASKRIYISSGVFGDIRAFFLRARKAQLEDL